MMSRLSVAKVSVEKVNTFKKCCIAINLATLHEFSLKESETFIYLLVIYVLERLTCF